VKSISTFSLGNRSRPPAAAIKRKRLGSPPTSSIGPMVNENTPFEQPHENSFGKAKNFTLLWSNRTMTDPP
jgi:hypothetical protein